MNLVGLIAVPLPVTDLVGLLDAYAKAYPGCTVGEVRQVEASTAGPGGTTTVYTLTAMPILTPPHQPDP